MNFTAWFRNQSSEWLQLHVDQSTYTCSSLTAGTSLYIIRPSQMYNPICLYYFSLLKTDKVWSYKPIKLTTQSRSNSSVSIVYWEVLEFDHLAQLFDRKYRLETFLEKNTMSWLPAVCWRKQSLEIFSCLEWSFNFMMEKGFLANWKKTGTFYKHFVCFLCPC